jgi:hypothetical protein
LAETHRYAGGFVREQGDVRGALSRLERALELMSQIGDTKHQAIYLLGLGVDCRSLGDVAAAVAHTERALQALEAVGASKGAIADAHLVRGSLALCEQSWEVAWQAFERAAELFEQDGTGWGRAQAALGLGRTYLAQGDREHAVQPFRDAIAFAPGDGMLLSHALSGLETAYDDPKAFHAYCRRLRAEYPKAGAAMAHWFLEPAEVLDLAWCPVREEFTAPLSPVWVWHDPFGDCTFTLRNGLEIHAANGRDLWHVNLSAPRLLRPASGEFGVETICRPASAAKPAIGGLLLWKDRENYLRLEWGTRGPHELLFRGCLADRGRIIGRGRLPSDRVWLRLERVGKRAKALCSADGQTWFALGQVAVPLGDPLEVGLFAVGVIHHPCHPGVYPEGTAIRFECFSLRR